MQIFDLKAFDTYPYKKREKNVFFKSEQFKARIIKLKAGGEIPTCQMESNVVFYVLDGTAEVSVNNEKKIIKEGQCMITEPATLSLKTEGGVKIVGFQIKK